MTRTIDCIPRSKRPGVDRVEVIRGHKAQATESHKRAEAGARWHEILELEREMYFWAFICPLAAGGRRVLELREQLRKARRRYWVRHLMPGAANRARPGDQRLAGRPMARRVGGQRRLTVRLPARTREVVAAGKGVWAVGAEHALAVDEGAFVHPSSPVELAGSSPGPDAAPSTSEHFEVDRLAHAPTPNAASTEPVSHPNSTPGADGDHDAPPDP